MRRAELLCVVLAGCMRIYPDPELPDVKVAWNDDGCRAGAGNVELTVTSLDSDAVRTEAVACTDFQARLADVARERFHVVGVLRDLAGAELARADGGEVDLRNGFDDSAYLYFFFDEPPSARADAPRRLPAQGASAN